MGNDTDTIREDTWSVETPSLDILGNEPVPTEILRDVLRSEWSSPMVERPEIHVLNDITYPTQGNLKATDFVILELSTYEEEQEGYRYEFKNVEIGLDIQIHTIKSRQHLYNVMAEVRRIFYKNNRAIRPFQLNYWDGFDEDSDGQNRYWVGTAHVRFTGSVPVFKGVVEGMGSENLPPDQR